MKRAKDRFIARWRVHAQMCIKEVLMVTLLLALMAAWVLGVVLTGLQIRYYHRFLATLRQQGKPFGMIASGIAKRRLGPGCVAVLVADDNGRIQEAYIMRGWTTFARFRRDPSLEMVPIEDLAVLSGKPSTRERAIYEAASRITLGHQSMPKLSLDKKEVLSC